MSNITPEQVLAASTSQDQLKAIYAGLTETYAKTVFAKEEFLIPSSSALNLLRVWAAEDAEQDRVSFVNSMSTDGALSLRTLLAYGQRKGSHDVSFLEALAHDLGRVTRGQARGVSPRTLLSIVEPTPLSSTAHPLHHMVHIQLKPDTSLSAQKHLCRVLGLLMAVPNVVDVRAGVVATDLFDGMQDRSNGINIVLYVVLKDEEALKAYGDHPLHTHIRDDAIRYLSAGPAAAVDFFDATSRL